MKKFDEHVFFHRQRLTDGATPIVVIDSEDILKNLQIASCLTEEDEESQLDE